MACAHFLRPINRTCARGEKNKSNLLLALPIRFVRFVSATTKNMTLILKFEQLHSNKSQLEYKQNICFQRRHRKWKEQRRNDVRANERQRIKWKLNRFRPTEKEITWLFFLFFDRLPAHILWSTRLTRLCHCAHREKKYKTKYNKTKHFLAWQPLV